jgi:hypothetical protein
MAGRWQRRRESAACPTGVNNVSTQFAPHARGAPTATPSPSVTVAPSVAGLPDDLTHVSHVRRVAVLRPFRFFARAHKARVKRRFYTRIGGISLVVP